MGADKVAGRIAVLLDANSLILMLMGKQLFEDIERILESIPEYICPDAVVNELRSISERGGDVGRAAKSALEVVGKKCIVLETGEKSGDRAIIELAEELTRGGRKVIVATSDRELRRRLSSLGVKTVYYRESQHRFEAEVRDVL